MADTVEQPTDINIDRVKFSKKENLINFGAVYGAQWIYYLAGQKSIIEDHGSLKNWYGHPLRPHFDKDSFDFNLFKHSLTGNYYYLWYRSRGHTIKNAFFWTFMSSLAFEFTIETITERPSYQDIYQTPVFGTVLGIGSEKLSKYFHSWDTWYGRAFGYLCNPFTLVPRLKNNEISAAPVLNQRTLGATVSFRY
ncbi:MAG TPA: DUF3943 domain-containing protein [Bacteriovoracaceae bacterium]|nr:DUF3943 domain-containing protein [Bacteriovoracaceae bacterium]